MDVRSRLAEHYPVFALEVRTPRLILRYPTDEDALELAELATRGVHAPDARPFTTPWTLIEPPHQQRNTLDFLWVQRGRCQLDDWSLPLVTVVESVIVGTQAVMGHGWKATRTFETGSWLGLEHHGSGIGTEMRAAALHLGFDGFGADAAFTAAFDDNPSSIGVTRSLGYQPNGHDRHDRGGELVLLHRFEMLRQDWERRRRDDIEVVGAGPVAAMFGSAKPPAWPDRTDDQAASEGADGVR